MHAYDTLKQKQHTQFIRGLEKERGKVLKEIKEYDKLRDAETANMTDVDFEQLRQETFQEVCAREFRGLPSRAYARTHSSTHLLVVSWPKGMHPTCDYGGM